MNPQDKNIQGRENMVTAQALKYYCACLHDVFEEEKEAYEMRTELIQWRR